MAPHRSSPTLEMEESAPQELNVAPVVFATPLVLPSKSPLLPLLSIAQPPEITNKNDREKRKPRKNNVRQQRLNTL